jgi:hypothetical protein
MRPIIKRLMTKGKKDITKRKRYKALKKSISMPKYSEKCVRKKE